MVEDVGDAGRDAGAGALVPVEWTRAALANLESIRSYITREGRPLTAQRLVIRLREAADRLGEFPMRGRVVNRKGLREYAVVPPYLIRYVVLSDRVRITRIKHGAQRR